MDDILIRLVSVLGNRDEVRALTASVGRARVNEALDTFEKLALTWRRRGLVTDVTLQETRRIISDLHQDVKER